MLSARKLGPAHDPDNVLDQLAPEEHEDERQLRAAARVAGLTDEQMRRAVVAAYDCIATARMNRIIHRANIRAAEHKSAAPSNEGKGTAE